jgi:hypothetical protein
MTNSPLLFRGDCIVLGIYANRLATERVRLMFHVFIRPFRRDSRIFGVVSFVMNDHIVTDLFKIDHGTIIHDNQVIGRGEPKVSYFFFLKNSSFFGGWDVLVGALAGEDKGCYLWCW